MKFHITENGTYGPFKIEGDAVNLEMHGDMGGGLFDLQLKNAHGNFRTLESFTTEPRFRTLRLAGGQRQLQLVVTGSTDPDVEFAAY